ncbi:hypothetical protein LOK49_LG11G01327 [Camellia lanceoleosa]|uniref:Uncharacterized protein n=1 Tax=Camellia lanceoleosa TaxID=1840588 RepID=A0ACC0FZ80_9ERIC|nr:hypothetical protein LOK49_LG11G01327 [Camellia lanceoleosa]
MATMKKRFVIDRIGETSLYPEHAERVEHRANKILNGLTEDGFIKPIYKNCGLVVDSYRIPPAIHRVLTAQPKLDMFGELTYRGLTFWNGSIFNVDAAIIDGRHEISFKRGTNLVVVYLERWQNSATQHIEVPEIKILNFLKNLKYLKFLSLRGISLIKELP